MLQMRILANFFLAHHRALLRELEIHGTDANARPAVNRATTGRTRSIKTLVPSFSPFADLIIAVGSAPCIWTRGGLVVTLIMRYEAMFVCLFDLWCDIIVRLDS